MIRKVLNLAIVVGFVVFCDVQQATAGAKDDLKIVYRDSSDKTTQLAYVTNTGSKAISVTIHWVNVEKGVKIGEGDKDYEVAPSKEAFIGGTKSGGQVWTYSVKSASYK